MTGRTDFQLANQKVEGMTKQMAILQEQQRLLQKDNLDMVNSFQFKIYVFLSINTSETEH
jgi:hypothetical protein